MDIETSYKWYVYELVDPRTNVVFYVGKGSGNRIDQHEAEASRGVCSKKTNKINRLKSLGFGISKRKVALFCDEQAAYDHETDVIKYYGLSNLSNILKGGQIAFVRRVAEKDERLAKKLTPLDYVGLFTKDKNLMYWFTQWFIAAESGTATVNITGDKYSIMFVEVFFGLCPTIWKSIKSSRDALARIAPIFRLNGVELNYGCA